jgi:xylulokinase
VSLVAGVDSSTQSVKVVVCDADTGEVVRSGRASHPDGTEVSAAAWLAAYREALSLAPTETERRFLRRRIGELGGEADSH